MRYCDQLVGKTNYSNFRYFKNKTFKRNPGGANFISKSSNGAYDGVGYVWGIPLIWGGGGEAKLVKIADFKKNCFIFKDHVREGYVCFANM